MRALHLVAGTTLCVVTAIVSLDLWRAADEPRENRQPKRHGIVSLTNEDVPGGEVTTDAGAIARSRSEFSTGRTVFLNPETNTPVDPPPSGLPIPERVVTPDTFAERVAEDGTVSVRLGDAFLIPLVAFDDCRGTLRRRHSAASEDLTGPVCGGEEDER